jgi:type I restriction enzyme, S subunit
MRTPKVRIGELVALNRRPVDVNPAREYTFLGVSAGGRGCFRKPPTEGSAIRPGGAFEVRKGDFLYSRLFAWKGSFEIAGEAEHGCLVSGEFPTFVVDTEKLDARWLRYWLLSPPGLREVNERSAGSTPGSRNRFREDRFLDLSLPLPSVEEQRRIAGGLDWVRERTTILRGLTDEATQVANALVASTASRPDLANDAKRKSGWRQARLGDLMKPSMGQVQLEPDLRYPIAGVYSFGRGLIDRGSVSGSEMSYRTLTVLNEGDIVVSKLNGWEGAVAVVSADFAGYHVSAEFPTFVTDRGSLLPDYFSGLATSPWFWDALDRKARGSMVRRRRIHPSQFLDVEIWLPPISLQQRAAHQLRLVGEAARARSSVVARIDALLPAALNHAFSGLN